MDKEFIKIAEEIINENGKDFLFNNRLTKAFFLDYGRGEYKNEINLLVKIIELEYSKKIIDSDDLNITKMILVRQLVEDHFINNKIANSIVLLLIGLLKDKDYLNEINEDEKVNKELQLSIKKNNFTKKPIIPSKKYINYNAEDKNATWNCPKCGSINSNTTYQCTNCGYALI
jgi:predicted RNA-binding Zn-ribbon protein involved in translation (DUF1610 family)